MLYHSAAQARQQSVNSHWLSQWQGSIFDFPQNRRSLTDRQKICHRFTTSTAVQTLVEMPPWGASGQIGEYNPTFLYVLRIAAVTAK